MGRHCKCCNRSNREASLCIKLFYKLTDKPFRLTPDPAYLYVTEQHREALSGLVQSISSRYGLTVLIGEAGTGKTMLLQLLRQSLDEQRFVTALVNNPTLTRQEFYDLVLLQMDVQCESQLKSRQLAALEETVKRHAAEGRRSLLIVDEAHALGREFLEEIRLLLNMETPREKLLEIVISGQPELADLLRRDDLRQLKQRVTCYCRLQPLRLDEVREYITHRLARAGVPNQTIFPEETIELIYQYSHGIPRLVNVLCDNALLMGFAFVSRQITPEILMEAVTDLDLAYWSEADDDREADVAAAVFRKSVHKNGSELQVAVPGAGVTASGPNALTLAPAPAVAVTEVVVPAAPVLAAATPVPAATAAVANGTAAAAPAPIPAQPQPATASVAEERMPLDSYASRQKSLGFLSSLMGRLR